MNGPVNIYRKLLFMINLYNSMWTFLTSEMIIMNSMITFLGKLSYTRKEDLTSVDFLVVSGDTTDS